MSYVNSRPIIPRCRTYLGGQLSFLLHRLNHLFSREQHRPHTHDVYLPASNIVVCHGLWCNACYCPFWLHHSVIADLRRRNYHVVLPWEDESCNGKSSKGSRSW